MARPLALTSPRGQREGALTPRQPGRATDARRAASGPPRPGASRAAWRPALPDRSLAILLRLREVAVVEAHAALARALTDEQDARAAEAEQADAIIREVASVAEAGGDGLVVEALAGWLAQARHRQARAGERRAAAEAAAAEARRALAAARGEAAAIRTLIERRAAEARAAAEKRAAEDLLEIILNRAATSPDRDG